MNSITTVQSTNKRSLILSALRNSLNECPVINKRSNQLKQIIERKKIQKDKLTLTKTSLSGSDSQSIQENSEEDSADEFFDNYEVREKIGQGCNATVYRCTYRPSGKVYAVKKIKLEQEYILTMKRDFITLKGLNHPSICKYKALYIIKEQRTAYLVMEYLPLPSLEHYQPEDQEELRIVVRQLLGALEYLHTRNICHRDIKPENILFDKKEKKIKLIDFGISKKTFLRGQRREMLTIIGTHHFMAPEVFVGGGYDERVDLWAVGVSIFKIVTGSVPFQSEYHSDIIRKICQGTFDFQISSWSRYSGKLLVFVQSLLRKVDQRISLSQAQKHAWFLEGSQKASKLRRFSSFVHQLHAPFHAEFNNNIRNATSREEGESGERVRLFKSIKSLDSNIFGLQESDDEDSVVQNSCFSAKKCAIIRQCSQKPSCH